MEKITKSFLALVLMLVGMVSALAQPVAPKAPEAPAAPKATALVTDGSVKQYLYNVGAKGFFIGANEWGTRASFSAEKGYWVQITKNATGDTYTLKNEAKGGNSADCQAVDQIWVDGAGRSGDALWTVTANEDGSFKLGNTNVKGFLSVVPSKNDTKLYMSEAEEAQNVWIVVSEEDYAAYQEAVPAYQAALKEYNDAYAQYQKDYAEWFKANYKAGESLLPLVPSAWEGQTGTYGSIAGSSERYLHGGSIAVGDVMTQTIDGLKNGKYNVTVEFAGSFTPDRGFECPTGDGLAVAFANTQEENLPIVARVGVGASEINVFNFQNVEVSDGVLKYGIKNVAEAGNWYVAHVSAITMVPEPDAWYTGNTFCYKDAANGVSRSMELPWVADPDDASNGCITLSSAAGAANDHDLQFMIRGAEYDGADLMKGAFAEGIGFKVSFKVKADGNYSGCLVGSFNSIAATGKDGWKFGNYLENQAVKMDVTTEWQTVSYSVLATADNAGKLTAIGFNLAEKEGAARTFYFDDVKISPLPWYNENNFNVIECIDDAIAPQGYARYNAEKDYIEVTTNNNPTNEWDCQIWMKVSDVPLLPGSTFTLDFEWKADREQGGIATQHHRAFSYIHYDGWGSYTAKTDWTPVSIKGTVSKNGSGMQCVCFNLSDKTNGANHFYIRNVEVSADPLPDEWYNKVKFTDKFKPEGVDQNKPAEFKFGEDGNGYIEITTLDNPVDAWDNQFFIQIADLASGGKFHKNDKVTMKFKAMAITDAEAYKDGIQTDGQFHRSPDGAGYIGNVDKVDIPVGAWSDVITKSFTITNPDVTNYCMNLSLAKGNAPIVYRFDDFEFEFESGTDDWYTKNVIVAKDPAVDYEDGKSYEFPVAPYNYDEGCIEVKSKAEPANAWASQIFFSIPEALVGKNVKISMKVKASEAIDIDGQRHGDNSGAKYGDNYAAGNISFTTEWTPVSFNFDPKKGEDVMACYVLNIGKKGNVSYFFDDVSFQEDFGALVEVPVEGTLVTEKDWTKETSYSYWSVDMPEGCTRTIENGIVIENTKTDGDPWANQMFTLDGLTFAEGKEYVLRYTLKINGEGDLRADVGPWGTNLVKAPDTQTLENGYRQVVFGIGPCAQEYTGAHAIWQSRKFVGKIIIEKVELFDITPDYSGMDWSDNIVPNGDLATDDMSAFILKNNDVEDPEMLPAEKSEGIDEIGIETVARPTNEDGSVGGNDHDAQFFVRLPYVLPKGTLFNLEFDLYAEEVNTIAIAAHAEPGQFKANLSSVKTDTSGEGIVHYQKYLTAPEDMRTIAFNLAVATDATYGFSNISVKFVNDNKAEIEAATTAADATSLWNETLALNEACYAGRVVDTEGCTEESVKALTDAVAAGKAELKNEAPTAESLAAATKAIVDAIAALRGGEGEYLPKPETDPDYANFVEIPQDQGKDLDDFARTAFEEGADFNTYTASGDLQVAFKMYDIDVAGCDYVTVKFAQPAPKGWNIAFWAQGGTDNVEIPEGATEYKYVFADDAKCAIKDDVLPQICVLTLWPGGYPFDMKVYGIYKHKVATVEDTDLTKEMFFTWDGVGADAEATAQAGCAYDINTSTGMPYGDGTVNEYNYADLSAYDHLAITATEGEPRLLFNRAAQDDHQGPLSVELPRDKGQNKYEAVVENTDGSKTYVINLKEIVAKDGYAHLHAIKGANWANTTVTEMKLFAGSSQYTDVLTNIFEVADDAAVKDGKYFINGQIVIVKDGVKYNAAGLPIE